jgi:hypothetical protein
MTNHIAELMLILCLLYSRADYTTWRSIRCNLVLFAHAKKVAIAHAKKVAILINVIVWNIAADEWNYCRVFAAYAYWCGFYNLQLTPIGVGWMIFVMICSSL